MSKFGKKIFENLNKNKSFGLSVLLEEEEDIFDKMDDEEESSEEKSSDSDKEEDSSSDEESKDSDSEGESDEGEGDEGEEQPPKPIEGQLSPQQIQSLLDAMNNEEKKVQDKMNTEKHKGTPTRSDKDW